MAFLRLLTATENRRDMFTFVFWTLLLTSIFSQALYQKSYLSELDYALAFIICVLAGAVMTEMGRALIGYVAAMALSIGMVFLLTTLAISYWTLPALEGLVLYSLWTIVLFRAFFPFPFMVFLVATIIGSALGEKYF